MTILRLIPLWLDLLKWINENENEDDQNMEKATWLSCRLMHRTPQSAYHVARYHHPPLWQQDWKTWFFIQVNSSPTNGELECDLKCWYLSTDQCVQGEIHRPSLCSSIPTLSDRVWQQWLCQLPRVRLHQIRCNVLPWSHILCTCVMMGSATLSDLLPNCEACSKADGCSLVWFAFAKLENPAGNPLFAVILEITLLPWRQMSETYSGPKW